ncbi:hypothetical protein HOY80DRAFT_1036179, partial [Tuber brumale]
ESDYQNFDEYFDEFFTEDNRDHTESTIGASATEPSPYIQLPDSEAIIEQELLNGLLERPITDLNGIILSSDHICQADAKLKYITEGRRPKSSFGESVEEGSS